MAYDDRYLGRRARTAALARRRRPSLNVLINSVGQRKPPTPPDPRLEQQQTKLGANSAAGQVPTFSLDNIDIPNPNDRENIKSIQRTLNRNGFRLSVDGILGPQTQAAWDEFRVRRGESADSALQANMQERIRLDAAGAQEARIALMERAAQARQSGLIDEATLGQIRRFASDSGRSDAEVAGFRDRILFALDRAEAKATAAREEAKTRRPSLIERGLNLVSQPIDQLVMQPYYAGQRARTLGASNAGESRAFLSGLPGLGFLGNDETSRRARRETDSWEERQALTEQGGLQSFGQAIFGPGWASGAADFALQAVGDPLNLLGGLGSASKFARVADVAGDAGIRVAARQAGVSVRAAITPRTLERLERAGVDTQAAMRAGRSAFLEGRTGQGLLNTVTDVLRSPNVNSATDLSKAVKGLTDEQAAEVWRVATREGIQGGERKLAELFIRGVWDPRIGIKNTVRARGIWGTSGGVGRAVVRNDDVLTKAGVALRKAARGDTPQATGTSSDPVQVMRRATEVGLSRGGTFTTDFFRENIAPQVEAMSPLQRIQRIIRLADESGNATLQDYTRELKGLVLSNRENLGELLKQSEFKRQLELFETTVAVAKGEAGERARAQALAELAQGSNFTPLTGRQLITQAKRNAGKPTRGVGRQAAPVGEGLPDTPWSEAARRAEMKSPVKLAPGANAVENRLRTAAMEAAGMSFSDFRARWAPQIPLSQARSMHRALLEGLMGMGISPGWNAVKAHKDLVSQYRILRAQRNVDVTVAEGLDRLDEATSKKVQEVVTQALRSAGAMPDNDESLARYTRAVVATKTSGPLQDTLIGALDAAVEAGQVRGLARQVEELVSDPTILREADRLAQNQPVRAQQAVVEQRPGLGLRSAVRGPANLVTDILESAPTRTLPFQSSENVSLTAAVRRERFGRWLASLGVQDVRAGRLADRVAEAATEEQGFGYVKQVLKMVAEENGVDPRALLSIAEDSMAELRRRMAFTVQAGEVSNEVQTAAQRIEGIPLPDAADVRRTITDLRAQGGDVGAVVRQALGQVASFPFSGPVAGRAAIGAAVGATTAQGGPQERLQGALGGAVIGGVGLRRIHSAWKWAIVTNLPAIAVGAAAGSLTTDGSIEERIRNAAIGGAIGAVAPLRYMGRVVLLEEKLRYYFSQGFRPTQFIPGVSRWARRRGLNGYEMMSQDLVRAGNVGGHHLSNRFLTSVDDNWIAIPRQGRRYVDALWRIVNHQIHVDTDELARLVTMERAGYLTRARADEEIARFLKSEDGNILLKRMKAAFHGPKTADEMVARYRTFINDHLPPEAAAARLDGEVPRDLLKRLTREGATPEQIHAQRTWIIPKSSSDVFNSISQMTVKMVLGGPTTKFNRIPLAEWVYRDEFSRLARQGVPLDEARRIADERAVNHTNAVMFQIDGESRFAKKIDFAFPFQQPREEIIRVWGKLAMEKPGRTMKVVRLAALAMNNGADKGIFYEDPFGEWRMTVPGSAWASEHLFGVNAHFNARLRDLLFIGQGAYGVGVIPSPGGPFWSVASRAWISSNPNSYNEMTPWLKQLLFPYGSQGKLTRPEPNRLWMAMVGSPAPWEFMSQFELEQEMNKWDIEMALQMRYQKFQETGQLMWPDYEEVKAARKQFFQAWAFMGALFPASTAPVIPGREQFNEIIKLYTNKLTGDLDYEGFVTDHPALAPFLNSKNEWVGPDDFKHWSRQDEDAALDFYTLHWRKTKTYNEFLGDVREGEATQRAYAELRRILANEDKYESEALMQAWRARYPQHADKWRNDYFRDMELQKILTYPQALREDALNRWRLDHNISNRQFQTLKAEAQHYKPDPWRAARHSEDVVTAMTNLRRRGLNEEAALRQFTPAEQVRWFDHKISEMDYTSILDGGSVDPQAKLDEYWSLRNQRSQVFAQNPELWSKRQKSKWEDLVQESMDDYYETRSALQVEIGRITAARNAAAEAKNWRTYYALRDKLDALYDQRTSLENKMYRLWPEVEPMQEEVLSMALMLNPKTDPARWAQFQAEHGDIPFVASREEKNYLSMPGPVRDAYIDDILKGLETPNGEKGKLFWEWLTDFQRDVIRANVPEEMVREWEREAPEPRKGFTPYKKKKWNRWGRGNGWELSGELSFAYELFKEYNKRGDASPPGAYAEYLKLPRDGVIRAQFLKDHPEVADWIKLGPLANMPEVYRYLVTNIMIKHGKWEGELRSIEEITELSFAREQMARWSRRGDAARPETYDLWLNMPTGIEKAEYLKAHPEIQEWISLGPMANMPDEYKDVVRDIMTRYGEWTEQQDPLGKTITEFYTQPAWARKAFLDKHPELAAYWAALRDPEEERLGQLADQYFAIQNFNARRLFLSSHPELVEHFTKSRTKRYEQFLNRVAQYMGQNPELFEHYLQRQEDILSDLLHKFAEPPMVGERPRVTRQTSGTERQRDADN